MVELLSGFAQSEWLGLASFLATIGGFVAMVSQLIRTARATEAATQAFERSERRMAINHLMLLLPQLHLLAQELDVVAAEGDRPHAIRTLASLSRLSNSVLALLEERPEVNTTFMDSLSEVSRMASGAKGALINDGRLMPKSATREVRTKVDEVVKEISAVSIQLSARDKAAA